MIYGKYIVALCLPRIHEETNHQFITRLSSCITENGGRVMVFSTQSDLYYNVQDEQGEKAVFELINYDITDAVVIHDEVIKDQQVIQSIISKAKAHNIPVFTLRGKYEGCHRVGFDYTAGFEQIVRHVLKDHGVTDFHMIAGIKDNDFSEERINVVRRVAQELDIPFGDEDISYGEFWSRPTIAAVEKLFVRRRALPQALICANDAMAIAAINVLKSHGVRIPEDIIVTGFDGIKEIKYSVPQITTCLCSNDQLAETLAGSIMNAISGKEIPPEKLVTPVLHKSASCGCDPGEIINASAELDYVSNSFFRFQTEEEHMFRMMSRILLCCDYPGVTNILDQNGLYDMIIVLNEECMDQTINPIAAAGGTTFGDTMKVIFNTDYPMNGRIDDIKRSDLHPNLYDVLNSFDKPLIFYSLNYMGNPMGYICFTFHDYDLQNYYKASQVVNTLNASFGAFRTIQYQNYLSEKIEEMYRCDGLTHLLNRMALKNSYPDLLKKCKNSMTLVLADLDGLKDINDTYGHDDGDFAICAVANALRNVCPSDSLCIRWGGDEMVAVIPGDIPEQQLKKAFCGYIDNLNSQSGKEYRISASVGIKSFTISETSDFEEMVRATDQLMYNEKKRKKANRKQKKAETSGC